jgi:hypothetical protein
VNRLHDLICDFIEIGVDIRNPVRRSAAKMDMSKLKKEFAKMAATRQPRGPFKSISRLRFASLEMTKAGDGGRDWKVRFCPDEQAEGRVGLAPPSLNRWAKAHPTVYLTHDEGTPLSSTVSTAWNGAHRSTEQEWDTYLEHRVSPGYNAIESPRHHAVLHHQ